MCEGDRRLPFRSRFPRRIPIDPDFKKVFARVIEATATLLVSWPGHGSLQAPEEELRGV